MCKIHLCTCASKLTHRHTHISCMYTRVLPCVYSEPTCLNVSALWLCMWIYKHIFMYLCPCIRIWRFRYSKCRWAWAFLFNSHEQVVIQRPTAFPDHCTHGKYKHSIGFKGDMYHISDFSLELCLLESSNFVPVIHRSKLPFQLISFPPTFTLQSTGIIHSPCACHASAAFLLFDSLPRIFLIWVKC